MSETDAAFLQHGPYIPQDKTRLLAKVVAGENGCWIYTGATDKDGSYEVLRVSRGAKCHEVGYVISADEAWRVRHVNAEWDRAEREWLEQPL